MKKKTLAIRGAVEMKVQYIEKRFKKATLVFIELANEIIEEYSEQGFDLTLRQLYYQLVSRDYIPNKDSEYKKLSRVISDARLAGLVDWDSIVDRTRSLRKNAHWQSPSAILRSVVDQYQIDKWAAQPYRPEVWIEKDALIGVIAPICETLDVSYFACRGYNSQSEAWRAGERFNDYLRLGQVPLILHLGDHDPSGLDMTRDVTDRFELFTEHCIKVVRLALNYDQVREYNPPPNPAKMSDPRGSDYLERFGRSSWELDALDPVVISNLINDAVLSFRDEGKWEESLTREAGEIQVLETLCKGLED